jgi:hypothetical protein
VTGFPTEIPRTRLAEACRALGVDPELVAEIHLSPIEAEFTIYVHDRKGRKLVHGDDVLKATITVPIGPLTADSREEALDAAA